MKRLIHILAASIAAMSLYSCGTAGYLASGYDVDELRDVVLFEPVAKIETIGKGVNVRPISMIAIGIVLLPLIIRGKMKDLWK